MHTDIDNISITKLFHAYGILLRSTNQFTATSGESSASILCVEKFGVIADGCEPAEGLKLLRVT